MFTAHSQEKKPLATESYLHSSQLGKFNKHWRQVAIFTADNPVKIKLLCGDRIKSKLRVQ